MIIVAAYMTARKGALEPLQEAIKTLIAETVKEEGCLEYRAYPSKATPGLFLFFERWQSEAHLQAHSQSAHMAQFGATAKDLLQGGVDIQQYGEPIA